jgi:hypothetical protein
MCKAVYTTLELSLSSVREILEIRLRYRTIVRLFWFITSYFRFSQFIYAHSYYKISSSAHSEYCHIVP